jgi:hypothetical protein
VTAFDPISSIERDVATHNRLRAWVPGLALGAVALGTAWGGVVGITVTLAFFAVDAQTGPTLALLAIALLGSAAALCTRRVRIGWRWALLSIFVVAATYWKALLIRADFTRRVSFEAPSSPMMHDATCFVLGLAASGAAALGVVAVHRYLRLAPSQWARSVGALIAAGCGLLAQGLYCPDVSLRHLTLGHLGQTLVAILIVVGSDDYLSKRWLARHSSKSAAAS